MRQAFCRSLIAEADDPSFVFLTGDLGFMALEELRNAMGARFINAGVAEQNMVSVAAGLAKAGLRPWVYSIAPFIFARPFEQIRNDVCLHSLPVVLVGNGGGYGYGVMGSSHHALEDYGALLTLPNMRAFIPAFDSDISAVIPLLMSSSGPCYLRLGLSEESKGWPVPPYSPWRRVENGLGPTVAVVGSIAGTLIKRMTESDPAIRPDLWVVAELPITELPSEFLESVSRSGKLIAIEEHTVNGGFGQMLAHRMLSLGRTGFAFEHFHSQGYVSGLYGSQKFHRAESGLDVEHLWEAFSSR
jgi:transketolase